MIEWSAILVTIKLAMATTIALLLLGGPLAWWLSRTQTKLKPIIEALTAMPLVLPPTVLGFYLLILLSPNSAVGGMWLSLTGDTLTFSFTGLVLASIVYSLPFMVQPLQSAFSAIDQDVLDVASTLGASRWDQFFSIVLPNCRAGILTAVVLTFAHTVGEFGVVLMVGGNIAEETRVISIAIYENVETLNYGAAHSLSLLLLVFSFTVLFIVYSTNRRYAVKVA